VSACRDFRERLAAALSGRADPAGAGALAWHEHLLGCGACRALLEAEEALELVLASLPAPELPARLAERVLARLAREREDALDGLLELDRVAEPADLPARLLAGLAAERARAAEEQRLDRLLERVPAPRAPERLPERVLAGLAAARGARPAVPARRRLSLVALAAAAALLFFAAWRALRPGEAPAGPATGAGGPAERVAAVSGAEASGEPDPELLRALDVLERWDLLVDENAALLFAALEPVEEQLLDLAYRGEEGG